VERVWGAKRVWPTPARMPVAYVAAPPDAPTECSVAMPDAASVPLSAVGVSRAARKAARVAAEKEVPAG